MTNPSRGSSDQRGGAPLPRGIQRLLLLSSAVVGVGATAAVASMTVLPLVAAVGVVLMLAAFYVPRVAAIVVICAWLGPVATSLLTQRIAGMPLGVGDFFMWVGLTGLVARKLLHTPTIRFGTRSRFTIIVLVWFSVVCLAVTNGVMAGNRLGTASDALLPCSAILSYFLFREAYRGRPRTFAQDVFVLAGVLGMLVVASALLGLATQFGTTVSGVYTRGVKDTALRIDAPAQRLALFGILLFAVGATPYRGWAQRWRWGLLAGMVGAVILSLTRSTWMPLILLVIVLPALTAPKNMLRTLARRAAIAALVGTVVLGLGAAGALGTWAQEATTRFASAADANVAQDDSYQQRLVENRNALLRIEEHPITGIGLPRAYGAFIPYNDPNTKLTYFLPRYFIHNTYLGIWMFMGLPGLLCLFTTVAIIVRTAWDVLVRREYDPRIPAAALATLLMSGIISSFQTNLMYQPAYAVIAAAMALIDVSFQARNRLTPSDWNLGTTRVARAAWRHR